MTRKLFGTDGIRGTANSEPMTPETALKVAMAVGECFQQRRPQASRRDRQGHPAVRLHARARADRRLCDDGHGRRAGRPAADPGDRHADAQPAGRSRRRALGVAQPLWGQRHQIVRPRRVQAVGRVRAEDRSLPRQRAEPAGRARRSSGASSGSTMRAAAISNSSSRAFPAGCGWTGCASSSIAHTAPPTRSPRRYSGSSAPRSSRSASRPTASTSTANAVRCRPNRCGARFWRGAPISGSRSTATPIG